MKQCVVSVILKEKIRYYFILFRFYDSNVRYVAVSEKILTVSVMTI